MLQYKLWLTCFEDPPPVEDPFPVEDPPKGDSENDPPKAFTQEQIDHIVQQRTAKARASAKKALEQMEALQKSVELTNQQREEMNTELDELRKSVLTTEEIAKREKKRADAEYENKLTEATESAKIWESQHNALKIGYEINGAANKNGVLPAVITFLEAYLLPKTKIVENKPVVDFTDIDADGKPIEVQLSINETVKRMKEQPEQFGHLFESQGTGGVGGESGESRRKTKLSPDMSQEEWNKLRKEDPAAIYT